MANVESPFAITNIRLFLTFRVLFNARFYYPIFSILFLDFGLTLSQFAILNAVWAATIVVCEVPSGALADILGRRNLLVLASMLMVVEIGLWAFVPRQNLTLLFWVFVLNRILSGMAEAAASGADEALAYDSLALAGKTADWGVVLERQGQLQAAGFVVAMTLGGVMYDPELMSRIMGWFGVAVTFSKDLTLRVTHLRYPGHSFTDLVHHLTYAGSLLRKQRYSASFLDDEWERLYGWSGRLEFGSFIPRWLSGSFCLDCCTTAFVPHDPDHGEPILSCY